MSLAQCIHFCSVMTFYYLQWTISIRSRAVQARPLLNWEILVRISFVPFFFVFFTIFVKTGLWASIHSLACSTIVQPPWPTDIAIHTYITSFSRIWNRTKFLKLQKIIKLKIRVKKTFKWAGKLTCASRMWKSLF
jgi:hypothetical protein